MQSIQLTNVKKPLNFSRSQQNASKQKLQNPNTNKDKSENKYAYFMPGLGCLAVAGVAAVAMHNKNSAKNLFKPFKEELFNFAAYLQKAKEANIKSAQDYMANCVEKNIIGTGQNSKVYKFSNPLMNNWVIKINIKHNDYENSFYQNLVQIPDEFEGYNMGQAIAGLGDRIQILKKINAQPHSIKDWSNHRKNCAPIKQEEATKFLDDIKQIAKFPQEAFNEYAQKLKLLEDKGYKADSFNPNNYMIDYKAQKFYIIDFYKYDVDAHLNTKYDLFCPLVDYPNFERFYNVMNDAQKAEYVNLTKILEQKCTKAAENAGINVSEDTFREFIGRIDNRENNNSMYTRAFDSMKNIIKTNKIPHGYDNFADYAAMSIDLIGG